MLFTIEFGMIQLLLLTQFTISLQFSNASMWVGFKTHYCNCIIPPAMIQPF